MAVARDLLFLLLKRMGFLGSDGVPTSLYDQFRNAETQGLAIAEGMKNAFNELFERNEYVYELSREKLIEQVVEITGATREDRNTRAIVGTFLALKELADFEGPVIEQPVRQTNSETSPSSQIPMKPRDTSSVAETGNVELKVGYNINLNLPETNDPEVFNAIFKALRENLLKK